MRSPAGGKKKMGFCLRFRHSFVLRACVRSASGPCSQAQWRSKWSMPAALRAPALLPKDQRAAQALLRCLLCVAGSVLLLLLAGPLVCDGERLAGLEVLHRQGPSCLMKQTTRKAPWLPRKEWRPHLALRQRPCLAPVIKAKATLDQRGRSLKVWCQTGGFVSPHFQPMKASLAALHTNKQTL